LIVGLDSMLKNRWRFHVALFWPDVPRTSRIRLATCAPVLKIRSAVTLRRDFRCPLLFQDLRPVELDLRIVLFDRLDCRFVERRPTDPYARRRSKPVEDAGSRSAFATITVDDERVFVAALVAAEPEVRQGYFLFCARAVLGARRAWRDPRDTDFRLGAGAAFRAAAAGRLVGATRTSPAGRFTAARRGAGAGAGRLTSGVLLWTSVKRVWSPSV
jgi:hypothetical protein